MVTLFDILRQAQSGTGPQYLAHRFGLDGQQMQGVLDALLPAFSLALTRSAQNPGAFAGLIDLVTSGRYGPFFDGGTQGAGPDEIAAKVFGSQEIATRIADQAAVMTGIGTQVMQRLVPVLAAMLVGGLHRYASLEGFADLLRQWSDALRTAARANAPAPPPRPADPWSAWFDMMSSMMGGAPKPAPPPGPPPATDPFTAWARIMSGAGAPAALPAPAPPSPRQPNPFEALAGMFEAGREVQAQTLAAFQSILDGAMPTANPRSATAR